MNALPTFPTFIKDAYISLTGKNRELANINAYVSEFNSKFRGSGGRECKKSEL